MGFDEDITEQIRAKLRPGKKRPEITAEELFAGTRKQQPEEDAAPAAAPATTTELSAERIAEIRAARETMKDVVDRPMGVEAVAGANLQSLASGQTDVVSRNVLALGGALDRTSRELVAGVGGKPELYAGPGTDAKGAVMEGTYADVARKQLSGGDTAVGRAIGSAAPMLAASVLPGGSFSAPAVGAIQGIGSARVEGAQEGWTSGQTAGIALERAALAAILAKLVPFKGAPAKEAARGLTTSVAKEGAKVVGEAYGIGIAQAGIETKLKDTLGIKQEDNSALSAMWHAATSGDNIATAALFGAVHAVLTKGALSETEKQKVVESAKAATGHDLSIEQIAELAKRQAAEAQQAEADRQRVDGATPTVVQTRVGAREGQEARPGVAVEVTRGAEGVEPRAVGKGPQFPYVTQTDEVSAIAKAQAAAAQKRSLEQLVRPGQTLEELEAALQPNTAKATEPSKGEVVEKPLTQAHLDYAMALAKAPVEQKSTETTLPPDIRRNIEEMVRVTGGDRAEVEGRLRPIVDQPELYGGQKQALEMMRYADALLSNMPETPEARVARTGKVLSVEDQMMVQQRAKELGTTDAIREYFTNRMTAEKEVVPANKANPNLPSWVNEEMLATGKNPNRLLNEVDAARPKTVDQLRDDPVTKWLDANGMKDLAEKNRKGEMSADQYMAVMKQMNAPRVSGTETSKITSSEPLPQKRAETVEEYRARVEAQGEGLPKGEQGALDPETARKIATKPAQEAVKPAVGKLLVAQTGAQVEAFKGVQAVPTRERSTPVKEAKAPQTPEEAALGIGRGTATNKPGEAHGYDTYGDERTPSATVLTDGAKLDLGKNAVVTATAEGVKKNASGRVWQLWRNMIDRVEQAAPEGKMTQQVVQKLRRVADKIFVVEAKLESAISAVEKKISGGWIGKNAWSDESRAFNRPIVREGGKVFDTVSRAGSERVNYPDVVIPKEAEGLLKDFGEANKQIATVSGHVAKNELQRMYTSAWVADLLKWNSRFQNWTEAVVKSKQNDPGAAKKFVERLQKIRQEMLSNEIDLSTAERELAQEFTRGVNNIPSGVIGPLGQAIYYLHDAPMSYLRLAPLQTAQRMAWTSEFGKDLGTVKTALEAESTLGWKRFQEVRGAAHNRPSEYDMLLGQRAGANSLTVKGIRTALSTLYAGKLVLAASADMVSLLVGMTPRSFGFSAAMRGLVYGLKNHRALEDMHFVQRMMMDLAWDRGSAGRNVLKSIQAGLLTPVSFTGWVNALQAAGAATLVVRDATAGKLSALQRTNMVEVAKALKFTPEEVTALTTGKATTELYDAFVRRSVSSMSDTMQHNLTRSKLENSQLFNMFFRATKYPMTVMRHMDRSITTFWKSVKSGDYAAIGQSSAAMTRMGLGIVATGVATHLLNAFYSGGAANLKIAWDEDKDRGLNDGWRWLLANATAGIGGPLSAMARLDSSMGVMESLGSLSHDVGVLYDSVQAISGHGRYKDLEWGDRAKEFLSRQVPLTKTAATWWGIFGTGGESVKLDNAIRARNRYFLDQDLPRSTVENETAESAAFRSQMKYAVRELREGKDPSERIKKALGVEGKGDISAALMARRMLVIQGREMDAKERELLKRRVGQEVFDTLQTYDDNLAAWALYYRPVSKLGAMGAEKHAAAMVKPPAPGTIENLQRAAGVIRKAGSDKREFLRAAIERFDSSPASDRAGGTEDD